MNNKSCFAAVIFIIFGLSRITLSSALIHHEIKAGLEPANHYITVTDQITIPADQIKSSDRKLHFLLHAGLELDPEITGFKLTLEQDQATAKEFGIMQSNFMLPEDVPLRHYSLEIPEQHQELITFTIKYRGEIYHPVQTTSEEYARSFSETPGIISDEGVVLAGSSYFVPWFNDQLYSFNLEVNTPAAWDAVSQGKRTLHTVEKERRFVRWESPEPMDEIYLIAAEFTEYTRAVGAVTAMVFLRQPDAELANKYLETTAQYMEMYRRLIGPFPYSKFALVENFWETGYGMPSFTLLGPKVIRFPWILHSSYPHELLHNWWGNSVFVDYDKGNWCEGITVYMADYLIKEQRGQATDYRRSTLQKFTDYVRAENDFPLTEFRSRHSAATAAVGYGKAMMLFHLLRYRFGDKLFCKAVQEFYRSNKFKKATFADVQKAFEKVTEKDLSGLFTQMVNRTGAPDLKIRDAKTESRDSKHVVSFTLAQVQGGAPYKLNVPVAIHLMGKENVLIQNVQLSQNEQAFEIVCDSRPLLLEIDPQFDVFRKPDRNEIPPALSQVLGAEKITIVLPSKAGSDLIKGYRDLANTWAKSERVSVVPDTDLGEIPGDRALWLFGRENKLIDAIKSGLLPYHAEIKTQGIKFGKTEIAFKNHCLIAAVRNPNNPALTIAWLSADSSDALPGLARKVPHYGKYSYLGFEGDEPTNVLKGQWPVVNSPLNVELAKATQAIEFTRGAYPARHALARLAPVFSEKELLKHVEFLAGDEMKGRGFGTPELDKAADYIAAEFRKAGLLPGSDDGSYFQKWQDKGGKPEVEATLKNVIGFIPGKKQGWEKQSVVICAHYDHLGTGWPDVHKGDAGKIHNGADDNASGVSVMIELAKLLSSGLKPDRNVVFVAFSVEECGLRGSKYYVENMKRFPAKAAIGCLNLDTVGRLGKNKLMILAANTAREWVHIFMGTGFVTGVEHEIVTEDLDASDQMSFIRIGVPAVQFFSGPHFDYHRPTDDIEKIDASGMVKVATFVREVIAYLAKREQPLTATISHKRAMPPGKMGQKPATGERASLGTMPDFVYHGEGVKIAAVSPGSAAENAGLKKGDILLKIDGAKVTDLKGFSTILKKHKPGDNIRIVYKRDKTVKTISVELGAR